MKAHIRFEIWINFIATTEQDKILYNQIEEIVIKTFQIYRFGNLALK
jgi:hypothetical protein